MRHTRGALLSTSFLIGLVLSVLLALAIGIPAYNIAQKNIDVRARVVFGDFLKYYRECAESPGTDCYCKEFDFSLLPRDYSISVIDLQEDSLGFELVKEGKAMTRATSEGGDLCTVFSSSGDFVLTEHPRLVMAARGAPRTTALAKYSQRLCFIGEPFGDHGETFALGSVSTTFNLLKARQIHCMAPHGDQQPPLFIIQQTQHPSSDSTPIEYSLPIYSPPYIELLIGELTQSNSLGNIGSTLVLPTTWPADIRYNRLLQALSDRDPSAPVIFLSINSQTKTEQRKDAILLGYSSSSPASELLATHLRTSLHSLDEKYYRGNTLVYDASEDIIAPPLDIAPMEYRLSLDALLDSSDDIPSYEKTILSTASPLSSRVNSLPAVFVTFVEHDNASPLLENHVEILAQRITQGVQAYLDEKNKRVVS